MGNENRIRALVPLFVGACILVPILGASLRTEDNVPPAIRTGDVTAEDRQWWSFRRLNQPQPPAIRNQTRVRTPVDAFILARLETKALGASADADRVTLLRRASFDLVGLPPSPEEIHEFLSDQRPDAYEQLLDRLLASPHFGERWGRHWLDAAGYVDVMGVDNDAGTVKYGDGKWRYRDYIVRSLNEDKPFDQFITEQLAGDEMADWRTLSMWTPQTKELLTATGFLRVAPDDTNENELNTPDIRHGILQQTGEIVVSNLLALTMNCAKCHDHKFEPITQRDYYSFLAVLNPAFNPENWLQPGNRELVALPLAEKAGIDRRLGELDQSVQKIRAEAQGRAFEKKLGTVTEVIRADVQKAIQTAAAQRNPVQTYLAAKFEPILKPNEKEIQAALSADEKQRLGGVETEVKALKERLAAAGKLQMVYDAGPPSATRVLRRGNHLRPGDEVHAALPTVLAESDEAALLGNATANNSSGRRSALARRLTDWQSPAGALVARVQVNRIWQRLFGKGIVETADNFGLTGTPPSHPELLEWLASEFVRNGRRIKPLVKLIMTSSVYRQTSTSDESHAGNKIDPDNRLLWRMPLRRLESEIVRDALLAASGKLDRSLGGPPVPVEGMADGGFAVKKKDLPTPTSQWRRSLYLMARRNYHPTLLAVFDQPVLTANCTCRKPSAVVSQSLTMLNDDFVLEQAASFAERVMKTAGDEPAKQIDAAFAIAFARKPRPQEIAWCTDLLQRQAKRYHHEMQMPAANAAQKALANLCHMLMNTNEFLYIG